MMYKMNGKRYYLNTFYSKVKKKRYFYFTRRRGLAVTLPPGYIVIEGTIPIAKMVDNIN